MSIKDNETKEWVEIWIDTTCMPEQPAGVFIVTPDLNLPEWYYVHDTYKNGDIVLEFNDYEELCHELSAEEYTYVGRIEY